MTKHSHYHKDVSHLKTVDVYQVCALFEVDDSSGATQHAIKKLLCPGKRGAKSLRQDLQEAVDTVTRRIAMIDEAAKPAVLPCDNPSPGPVMADPLIGEVAGRFFCAGCGVAEPFPHDRSCPNRVTAL